MTKRLGRRPHVYLSCALTNLTPKEKKAAQDFNRLLEARADDRGAAIYLPQKYTDPHDDTSSILPEDIYILDRWRVAEADVLVINASSPSTGVGQEVEIATQLGIPVVGFYEKGKKVTRMVRGVPSMFLGDGDHPHVPSEAFLQYNATHAMGGLSAVFADRILDKVDQAYARTKDIFSRAESVTPRGPSGFGARLRALMGDMSAADLADRAGLTLAEVEQYTMTREQIRLVVKQTSLARVAEDMPMERFHNPSITVLRRLAIALGVTIHKLIGGALNAEEVPDPTTPRASFPEVDEVLSLPSSGTATPVTVATPVDIRDDQGFFELFDYFVERDVTFGEFKALRGRFGLGLSFSFEPGAQATEISDLALSKGRPADAARGLTDAFGRALADLRSGPDWNGDNGRAE